MDSFSPELTELMRELSAQRDGRFSDGGPSISSDRLKRLQAALADKFPVETGLRSAAIQRDALLRSGNPQLPTLVENELIKRLAFARQFEATELRQFPERSMQMSRRSVASAAAIAAAVMVLFGTAFYFSGGSDRGPAGRVPRDSESTPASMTESADSGSVARAPDHLFANSGDHLTLRVSKIELASFQPSLLTANRAILAERLAPDRGLPLDLPIREMLLDPVAPAIP